MSSMEMRLQRLQEMQRAALGLRRALMLWPDKASWCQESFTRLRADGGYARCLVQVLTEGLGRRSIFRDDDPVFNTAANAVLGAAGYEPSADLGLPSELCNLNNRTADFDTLKGYVERAAESLERMQ